MISKVHLYDPKTLENAPVHTKALYARDGFYGTKCGYVRKNITENIKEVTCANCIKKIICIT